MALREIRICATCRHFEVLQEYEEIEGLRDTLCVESRCRLLGLQWKEFPAMEPVPRDEEGRPRIELRENDCPYWEPLRSS